MAQTITTKNTNKYKCIRQEKIKDEHIIGSKKHKISD